MALQVRVTNLTAAAESFRLVVSNLTRGTAVATQQVTALAGLGDTNIALTWNTAAVIQSLTLPLMSVARARHQ